MQDKQKRKRMRRYFQKSKFGWPIFLIMAGAVAVIISFDTPDGEPIMLIGFLLAILGGIMFLNAAGKSISRPSDSTIDKWFEEDLEQIHRYALKKLGLTEELLGVKKEPLRAIGPILWPVSGVPDQDLLWKKGRDGLIRFAVYEVVLIYTAEHLLAAYNCDFNSLKNVTLNEETYEFHYQDIVSVATSESSTSYTLPNKEKLVVAQEFKVSVSSGESIDVVIDSPKLYEITKGDVFYKSEVENTVNRLRSLLRDKKQPSTPPPAYSPPPQPARSSPLGVEGSTPHAVPPSGTDEKVPSASPPEDYGGEAAPARPVNQPTPDQRMVERFCSNCGRELKPSHRFCPGCGRPLNT
ncbi:MAG: zinc ribbon domain-containing protein [Anaerolineales bacterium]|jgi:hypothetical protein